MRKNKVKKKRNLFATIFLYFIFTVFFGVATFSSWLSYFRQYEIVAIMDKNIIVMATLTEVRHGKSGGESLGPGAWFVWYEFTDDDGTYYDGSYRRYNINRKEEAEAQIGKQVEIYIDGNGNSIIMRERPNSFTYYFVAAIIFTILAVGAVTFIIIKEVLLAKDRALLKKIRGS